MIKKHILLIENDETEVEFFTDALEESRLEFLCNRARNVEQALRILKHIVPDIIFLDINLSRISGISCLQKIKKIEGLKDVPVILYSSMAEQSGEEAICNGASSYMLLPGNVGTMASLLLDFTDKLSPGPGVRPAV